VSDTFLPCIVMRHDMLKLSRVSITTQTQEITGGMNEMVTGAEQVNVAVHNVNDISGKNREGIEVLIQEVSRFKVE